MRTDATTADLGDDVIYAVGRSETLTLLVLNTRPVSRINREHAQAVIAASRALRARSAEQRRKRQEG